MVTWYDIISSRWSSHFWVKLQVKLVDEMIQSVYLCVILHVKHKNSPFIAILTWFLILGKIQDGGQDGDNFGRRHRPPTAPPTTKCTYSCWEDQRLSTEGKVISKCCNISKTLGRCSIKHPSHPPPPPHLHVCTTVGVWSWVYVRGLTYAKSEHEFYLVNNKILSGNVYMVQSSLTLKS